MLSSDGQSPLEYLVNDFVDTPSAELKRDDDSTAAAASQEAYKGMIYLFLKLVERNLYIWKESFI